MSLTFISSYLSLRYILSLSAIRIGAGAETAEAMMMLITRTLEKIGP